MKQRNLITLLAAAMMVAFAVASAAEAATTINTSRSNNLKTKADCTQAGGKWVKGSEGLGCYMPLPAKSNASERVGGGGSGRDIPAGRGTGWSAFEPVK